MLWCAVPDKLTFPRLDNTTLTPLSHSSHLTLPILTLTLTLTPTHPPPGGATYCPGRRFARNEVKTIVAVLLTQFDLAIVDPPSTTPTATPTAASTSATTSGGVSSGDVFDTREVNGPGINGARAGLGIFSPKNEVRLKISRKKGV